MTKALLIISCALAATAATARAQAPSSTKAKAKADAVAAYKQGQQLYRDEDYEGAARQFKAAYDLDPDPVYLFNIAQAYRLGRKCKDSSTYYQRYLDEAKRAPNADAVKASIAEMDACAKEQEAASATPPPARVVPVEPAVPVEPSRPEVVGTDEPVAGGSNKRLVGYIVGGGGVALTGLGFFFMSRVSALEDDANAICPQPCAAWDERKTKERAAIDDKAALREKLMVGSWIAGGAAIAAGVYLIVTGGAPTERSIAITPTRNGAMATFRF